MFTPPRWLRRLLGLYDRVPAWARYGAAVAALVALGAVLL